MRRRGSFDPSDYAFGDHVLKVGEILRASQRSFDMEELARLLSRASALPGDARRAAYQIEGREDDRERGWVLLTEQALRVLKRARVIEQNDDGWLWTKDGPDPIVINSYDAKVSIYTAEGRARVESEAERRYRLQPNPFTDHHLHTNHPLIDPALDNLPGRAFDPTNKDTQELRESLIAFGFIPQLPILIDEHGITLNGRTRERLCRELQAEFPERDDLTPVRQVLELGDGPEGNAQRLKIALAANTGGRNLSTRTKQEVARYLYDDRNWTYQQIGEAFNVSKMTAGRLVTEGRTRQATPSKPKRHVDDPKWRAAVDPLIHDWIDGKLAGDDVRAEMKARDIKGTGWGTIQERRAQVEAEIQRAVSESNTVILSESPVETKAPQTPNQPDSDPTEASERDYSITELISYSIAELEEHNAFPEIAERLRTVLALLDGSISEQAEGTT